VTSGPRWTRDQSEFDRAIGFVDATFAFALTLLATTLDIGDVRRVWDSTQALGAEINPQLIAFLISFAVISSYWLAHHRMIASFTAIDTPVIVANLALIATIVVLPFATEAVGSPNIDDLPLPTAVLAINVAAASGVNTLVYVLGAKRGLIDPEPSRTAFTADVVRGLLRTAARLLRPGGWLGIEHADQQGTSLPALVRAHGGFVDVADHPDLAGRPRFTTAQRAQASNA